MISIVIPLYDKVLQVRETLESVRGQTFTDYDVLIVDDGSTDGSREAVVEYLLQHKEWGQRVRLIQQEHAGVSVARNTGISESRSEWIAFLDADDVWTADYLATQYALSQKYPFCSVLASGYWINYGRGRMAPAQISKLAFEHDGELKNYFESAACSHPPITTMMTMAKRVALEEIGGFPVGIGTGEDLLTWARLALHNRIGFTRRCLGFYTQDPDRWNKDQQVRMPDAQDQVGKQFAALLKNNPDVPGLRKYVGSWYKMRVRIYLSHSMRRLAWSEWKKMLKYTPFSYKTWVYGLLLINPVRMMK